MLYIYGAFSFIEVIIVTIPVLLVVAFVTVAERKTMASMQRRLGPNKVGFYGLLQAFADALKLLLKEYVSPTQANLLIFFLGPIITLIFSLLGYGVVPVAPGGAISDFDLGILYMLAMSSLATYGILLAGWSANSKYAFLGSLRSTAQLISYELVLTSAILIVILLTSSLNLTANIESQKPVWFLLPLAPLFYIFFIGSVAETNRAPFDLAEAESELVSGFMTEHSAVIFVFFFLAEYGSIILMCILTTILFIGGYSLDFYLLTYYTELFNFDIADLVYYLDNKLDYLLDNFRSIYYDVNIASLRRIRTESDHTYLLAIYNACKDLFYNNIYINNSYYSIVLSVKAVTIAFVFIWVRASFPRVRFDQLMDQSWTKYLPLIFAFILIVPVLLYYLDAFVLGSVL